MKQESFDVIGMHCASCSNIIRKKLSKLPGISDCNINFATEKADISFDPSLISVDKMNEQIEKLGYSLEPKQNYPTFGMDHSEHLGLTQTKEKKLKDLNEAKTKLNFILPLTFITFGYMIWDILSKTITIPAPMFSMRVVNTVLFLISIPAIFWVGKPFVEGFKKFLRYRVANMDTLIGIGTLTAFVYSSVIFLFPEIGNLINAPKNLYFDVVVVVIGFVTLGKYLEARSKIKTGESIEKLISLQAKTALVVRSGKEVEIPISDVLVNDIVIVKPGAKIPTDGIITEGQSSVDESMISGEPIPQDKKIGDLVIGSTINKQGAFMFKAQKVGNDTMLAQIIKLVEDAQGSKADIEGLADKVSSIFVPVVLLIAFVSFILWITLGTYLIGFSLAFPFALLAFVGILVIACPCALGLATPTAIIVGTGKGAENGILIKNAQSLEKLYKAHVLILDKTGTITHGNPVVTDIVSLNKKFNKEQLIEFAASIENKSSHPLALAILKDAKLKSIKLKNVSRFKEEEGNGVQALVGDYRVEVRKPNLQERGLLKKYINEGKTTVAVVIDNKIAGAIIINDTIRENARETISDLKKLGIKTVMVTGDNKKTADFIANQVGVDEVISEVLPQEKAGIIKKYQKDNNIVAMVGDGINDAPALSTADVGIAMATGTDIAIESADLVLLNGDIAKVPQAFRLSKATMRTVKQNLFWAFIYNLIGIPLAAGFLYPIIGVFLNPVFAGAAMAMSSVSVVTNSLLLRKAKI